MRLVNGQLRPVVAVRPGETQLWRLVNAGADISYQLALDGFRLAVVGEDGRPVAVVTTPTALRLPPGKRFDVLVTAPETAGAAQLRTTAFNTGPTGDTYPDAVLAEVTVAGSAVTPPLPVPPAAVDAAGRDLSHAQVTQRRTVLLSQDRETGQFTINGRPFSMAASVFDSPAVLGTVEEWTILNASGADHPFH
nr:multicopper oxidase domain-containing protein [Micromonospora sp. DSM 115978]